MYTMSTSKNKIALRYEENRGSFIKPCPGTPRYVCCGYRIINIAHGCTLGCTYCILDHYFDSDTPVLFSNVEKLYEELITEGEGVVPTSHEKIMVLKGQACDETVLNGKIDELKDLAYGQKTKEIKEKLQEILPEYQPEEEVVK